MSDLRIGIIGAGAIFRQRHIPGLRAIEGVCVVAVSNRTRESSERAAAEFGIPEVEEDWQTLVARPDLDAVFIGTWPYMHREMSVAVLGAGKHCFCQARMAATLPEAKAMLEAAEAHPELVAMICPPPTRMPYEPFFRQVLDSGELGEITLVELKSVSGANLQPGLTWRERIEFSGQQVLLMGIFAETLNAIVGPYESLSAQTATPIDTKIDGDKPYRIQIPQVVTISGRLTGGALAVEHHTGMACDNSTPGNSLTIWGTKGTLRYGFDEEVWLAAAGGRFRSIDVPEELRRGWQVERDFVDAVRAAKAGEPWSVSPDFKEGLLYMRKVAAVHASAASGRAVRPADL